MRKLALKLDDLTVESFPTEPALEEHGTVFGAQESNIWSACVTRCETCGIDPAPFRRGEGGVVEEQIQTRGVQCACA
jgi:hypothetical protein